MISARETHAFKAVGYDGVWLPFEGDRMALREEIASYLSLVLLDPSGLLEIRADGPHWVGGAPLSLSYAHSRDRALLVYSQSHRVGVDIEHANRIFAQSPSELAARFFHPSEQSVAQDPRAFLELWCRKEALGKWSRGGLREMIGRPVDPAPTGVRLEHAPVAPEGWVAWVALSMPAASPVDPGAV